MHTIKTTSNVACKSLSRSLNKLLLYHFFVHETFSFSNTIQTFLRKLFWWIPTWTRGQNTPWCKGKRRSEQKSRQKTKAKCSSRKENTRWTIRVKNGVFLAMKNGVSLSPKQTWCDPTIYCSKQSKRKLKAKAKTLQEKRIVHEAIKI
jgi:hypothetical protein